MYVRIEKKKIHQVNNIRARSHDSIFLPYRLFFRFGVFRLECSDGTVI
jgi:hypothetical protein